MVDRRRIPVTAATSSGAETPVRVDPGPVLVLTDRSRTGMRSLVDVITSLAGLDGVTVVFREKDLDPEQRSELARDVAASCRAGGLGLIVASDVALATALDASGVHLAASDPAPDPSGPSAGLPFGRSVHGPVELSAAHAGGAAWVTLSPVWETTSKPGYGPALGLRGLGELALGAHVPVYALGGVTPGRAASCVLAGARGVAAMGVVIAADDPRSVVAAMVHEVVSAWEARAMETDR